MGKTFQRDKDTPLKAQDLPQKSVLDGWSDCNQVPESENLKQHLFSHSFVSWKLTIRVPAGLVSGENSHLGLQTFFLHPSKFLPLCLQRTGCPGIFLVFQGHWSY